MEEINKGTSDAERLALALSLLDEKPDVIAILGVRQQHIPADVLNKIYGLVEDGSSSLLLSGLACKTDSMKTELQDEAEQICRLIPRHCLTDFYFLKPAHLSNCYFEHLVRFLPQALTYLKFQNHIFHCFL